MQSQIALLTHPALQPFWVLLLCVLVERIWVWPDKYHPLTFSRMLAQRMALKVNKDNTANRAQQLISGGLAVVLLVLPVTAILSILINMAEYPIFFDALLLLVSLQFQPILFKSQKISQLLALNKKSLAREILATITLRETHSLSPLGIAKANIESLLLRFNHQFSTVIFWYFILGGSGAFAYRLVYELSHVWNTKLLQFKHFGFPTACLAGWMQWIPLRINILSVALAENISGAWHGYKTLPGKYTAQNLLLAIHGGALSVELGGPAYYEGRKVRSIKCGGSRQVRHKDLTRALSMVFKTQCVLMVLYFLAATSHYVVYSGLSL